jgi:hypothetical protein
MPSAPAVRPVAVKLLLWPCCEGVASVSGQETTALGSGPFLRAWSIFWRTAVQAAGGGSRSQRAALVGMTYAPPPPAARLPANGARPGKCCRVRTPPGDGGKYTSGRGVLPVEAVSRGTWGGCKVVWELWVMDRGCRLRVGCRSAIGTKAGGSGGWQLTFGS